MSLNTVQRRRIIFLIILVTLLIIFPFISPNKYLIRLVNHIGIFSIVVIGLNFTSGMCGLWSLGHAAFWGIGAYGTVLLMTRWGFSFWLAFPLGGIIAMFFGLVVGFPTLRLKRQYLALVTLGFAQIVYIVLVNWQALSGGAIGIGRIPLPRIGNFSFSSGRAYYYLILFFAVLTYIAAIRIKRSRWGRAMESIRESELAAEVIGVNVTRIKVTAFALSALVAGLGGGLYAPLVRYINPDSFTISESITFLVMLLVGGRGSVPGSVLGAAIVAMIPEFLRFLRGYYQLIYGATAALIIVFLPRGLISGFARIPLFAEEEKLFVHSPDPPGARSDSKRMASGAAAVPGTAAPLLEIRNITKRFGGLVAVDDVDLTVYRGEITAVIGPNGSGKTTLLNTISGIYAPEEGDILWKGNPITGQKPHTIAALGCGRTFQNIRIFPDLSALENVKLGLHVRSTSGIFSTVIASLSARREEEYIRSSSTACLELVGLAGLAGEIAKNLPYGKQRLLEIARVLVAEPQLLLLDEPAAGLNPNEASELAGLLKQIQESGTAILLVEHNMRVAMSVADRVCVLNFGEKIADDNPKAVQQNSQVIEAYLGRVVEDVAT